MSILDDGGGISSGNSDLKQRIHAWLGSDREQAEACLPLLRKQILQLKTPPSSYFSLIRFTSDRFCKVIKLSNSHSWQVLQSHQTIQLSLLFSFSSVPVCRCLPTAKSLQEFAGVLQNLEDERTRMVSEEHAHTRTVERNRRSSSCRARC